jgi:carbamoyltransferase
MLFNDGEACSMLSEEKFTNRKNSGGLPLRAIRHLAAQGCLDNLDRVAISSEFFLTDSVEGESSLIQRASMGRLRRFYNFFEYHNDLVPGAKHGFRLFRNHLYSRLSTGIRRVLTSMLSRECNLAPDRIVFLDHHRIHCLTPYYFYGLAEFPDDILAISIDGDGDRYSGKVLVIPAGHPECAREIAATPYDASLGYFYAHITTFLGMKALEHEYKVMGLAAYADEDFCLPLYRKLQEAIWVDEEQLQVKSKFNLMLFDRWLKKHFVGERFDRVAGAAQKFLEDIVTKLVRAAIRKTGIPNVAVSGGVFMNVKLNHRIVQMPEVQRAFFMPACGDESLPVGAGSLVAFQCGNDVRPVRSMHLGLQYDHHEVEKFLRPFRRKYRIRFDENIEQTIAVKLAKREVVARFRGAGEWGARALGNRSILANPSDLAMFHEVNDQIKMRDFWMPFAPTILFENAPEYIEDWNLLSTKSPESLGYMILAATTTPAARQFFPAAMHQRDKSIRPQILRRADNPLYHSLIGHFRDLTGIGGVLNTSMNLHGFPLVGTLEQAMFTFENSKLQNLALEDFLVERR